VAVQALKNQLLRDLKASWRKSALLAVLLVVGLIFWIPPLVRAVRKSPIPPAAVPSVRTQAQPTVTRSDASTERAGGTITWQTAERILETDPLVRSAEVAAIHSEPFRVDRDQFPPPILFAEEPAESKPQPEKPSDLVAPIGLVLKSTIVGVSRRAAYINTKLYFEGAEIRGENGQVYRLKSVHPRKVVLDQDGQELELKITEPRSLGAAAQHVTDDGK
jgi:hypothetical protein